MKAGKHKVIIRTDASNAIGMGHINRCISLARHIEAENIKVLFVLKYFSEKVLEDFQKVGINFFLIEECCTLIDEAYLLAECFHSQYSAIVFDFAHYPNMKLIQNFVLYFEILHSAFQPTFLIDGFKDTAIINYINPAVDTVITPYLGAVDNSPDGIKGYSHWIGPSYFIFSPEYTLENWQRKVNPIAKRLLITMGGSDPYELTLIILKSLKLLTTNMQHRVIIGPGFSNDLKHKIRKHCSCIKSCEIIDAPTNLVKHLKWAEMAISASGLTKYEMAFTGVPSLQLSFTQEIADITATYEKEGFYRDLGLYTERTIQEIALAIDNLSQSFEVRNNMIKRGQTLFSKPGIKQFVYTLKNSRA